MQGLRLRRAEVHRRSYRTGRLGTHVLGDLLKTERKHAYSLVPQKDQRQRGRRATVQKRKARYACGVPMHRDAVQRANCEAGQ